MSGMLRKMVSSNVKYREFAGNWPKYAKPL